MSDPYTPPKSALGGVNESIPPLLWLIFAGMAVVGIGIAVLWQRMGLGNPAGAGEILAGVVFCVSYSWGLGASFVSHQRVEAFLERHSEITGNVDLEAFKSLARWSMRLALVQIAVLAAGFFAGLALLHFLGLRGLVLVLVTNGALGVMGKIIGSRERIARSLSVSDPQLREEYLAVAQAWVKEMRPSF